MFAGSQRRSYGHRGRNPARRPFAWVLSAGLLAVSIGAALVAPTIIQAAGLGSVRQSASALAETLPAPAPGTASGADALGGSGEGSGKISTDLVDGPVDGVAFEIIVPSLGYRATVLEGTDLAVLDRAPGHYLTTAWPGHTGNVGIAAHNTYWIALGNLKPGDSLQIQTRHGLFAYEIRDIKVVNPDDRTVLAATNDHRLTLTTCYPLWAGAWATQRLIFTALEVGGVA